MKATVHEERCVGCETCVDICPDVFAMHDGLAVSRYEGDLPSIFEAACREAAAACPLDAIELED